MQALLIIAALISAGEAEVGAQETYGRRLTLDGAASTRTFTITNPRGRFSIANLEVNRIRASGTDLTMTCKSTSRASTTPTATREICTYDSNGICVSKTATMKSTTSVSEIKAWPVNILGWERTDCVLTSTAAAAGDKATVTGRKVTQ